MAKLLEILKKIDSVQVVDSIENWQDSVRLCLQPLLNQHFLRESYIDAAIKSAINLNFYYLISEGLAMPHARPEEGALKNGFSMLIVKKGIHFGEHRNNPVFCLIGFTAIDSKSHIDAMMDISTIFGDDDIIPKLISLSDPQAVLEFLEKSSS